MARVTGSAVVIETIETRPANTTAYAAGDVVGDGAPITFANAAREGGGSGFVLSATISRTGNEITEPDLELWLFSTIPSAVADNAAFAPGDAAVQNVLGVIEFDTTAWYDGDAGTGGTAFAMGAMMSGPNVAIPPLFTCDAGSTSIYGMLVVRNAYTPISAEVFHIRLCVSHI